MGGGLREETPIDFSESTRLEIDLLRERKPMAMPSVNGCHLSILD